MVEVASEGEGEVADTTPTAGCASEAIRAAGAGALKTVNVSAFDVPPPPPSVSVNTVTGTIATVATSAAEIAAFTPVGPANVVVRGDPFH